MAQKSLYDPSKSIYYLFDQTGLWRLVALDITYYAINILVKVDLWWVDMIATNHVLCHNSKLPDVDTWHVIMTRNPSPNNIWVVVLMDVYKKRHQLDNVLLWLIEYATKTKNS